jgi:hypothetical protein
MPSRPVCSSREFGPQKNHPADKVPCLEHAPNVLSDYIKTLLIPDSLHNIHQTLTPTIITVMALFPIAVNPATFPPQSAGFNPSRSVIQRYPNR